jgi:CDP-diacylglycerol--glycerol-3-phosphate 3-phosphatidyltransferase
MDRVADMVVLLGVVMHQAASHQTGVVVLAGYTLVTTVLVSYSKARAEKYVPHFEGGFFERAERIVILILGGLTGFVVPALWVVAIGSTVTVLQRFAHAHREMERLDGAAEHPMGEHP